MARPRKLKQGIMPTIKINTEKMREEQQKELSVDNILGDLAEMFIEEGSGKKKKASKVPKAIWEEEPVDIETFCLDEYYLNLGDSIRHCVLEDLKALFANGDHRKIVRTYKEAIFDEAIGCGKCLVNNTRIALADGTEKTIEELYKSGKKVWNVNSLNTETLKIETVKSSDVIYNGKKPVYKIILRSGKEITLTDNHPLFTKVNSGANFEFGWKQVKDLKEKDFIATPRYIKVKEQDLLSIEEIKVLAYMIGDGSTQKYSMGFANINPKLRNEFEECFKTFEKDLQLEEYLRDDKCYGLSVRGKNKKDSKIMKLLKETGLLDKKSDTKFIPWQIKVAPLDKLAIFLTRLLATDGCISPYGCIGYGTISERLANDLVTLLLRFGIHSTLSRKVSTTKVKGKEYVSYEVNITGQDALEFFDKIGYIYGKEEKCKKAHKYLLSIKRNTNTDIIPFKYSDMKDFNREYRKEGVKYREANNYQTTGNFSRERMQKYVDSIIKHDYLEKVAYSDIFWDRIESIRYIGEEDVYDLSIPKNHNFVANNIIVHNSFKLAILIVYFTYLLLCMRNPQATYGLAPRSKLAIMNMSVSADQARRVVFGEIKNKIDASPWFQEKYPPNPRVKSELQFDVPPDNPKKVIKGKIYKNVYIIPGSSSGMAPLGYNLFVVVIDEATLWRDTSNKDYVEDVYNIVTRRITSRFADPKTGAILGFVALGGSPMYYDDFLERRIREANEENAKSDKLQKIFVVRRSQWEAKMPDWNGPKFWFHVGDSKVFETVEKLHSYRKKIAAKAARKGETNIDAVIRSFNSKIIEIPIPYLDDFKKNPEGSKRDLAGLPSETIEPFFENPDIIEERCNYERANPVINDMTFEFKSWFRPISRTWHAMHIDLAVTGDACGIALGHNEGTNEAGSPIHFIDMILRLQGSKEEPIQIEWIRELIYKLTKMGFMIGIVTLDGFQSIDTMQILTKKGYLAEYLSVDRDTKAYTELKNAIYEDRLDYYEHNIFMTELKKVEKNKNKIDHPRNGSKDCSDAVAGVVYNLTKIHLWEQPDDDDADEQVMAF